MLKRNNNKEITYSSSYLVVGNFCYYDRDQNNERVLTVSNIRYLFKIVYVPEGKRYQMVHNGAILSDNKNDYAFVSNIVPFTDLYPAEVNVEIPLLGILRIETELNDNYRLIKK